MNTTLRVMKGRDTIIPWQGVVSAVIRLPTGGSIELPVSDGGTSFTITKTHLKDVPTPKVSLGVLECVIVINEEEYVLQILSDPLNPRR